MKGLPAVLNLAAAGGTDLALTSDIVTDGMTAMGISIDDAGGFVDIMAATCSNANTNIELMGETLKYVGPVAGALGISMDDLSLAIGLMGNAGLKGSQAGTALRAGLTNLVKPTAEMQKAMKKYGVEVVKTGSGSVDFMGTIENLREKLGGLSETEQAAALASIFGKEAMSGWASIVNASEKDFNKLNDAILESNGVAKSMSDTMMQGAKGALTEMKSALEGVAITIGERLAPFIESLADWITNLCAKFQELSPATQTVIMIIAALIAALGPLLIIGGMLIKGFVLVQTATLLLGTTITGLITTLLAAVAPVVAVVTAIGLFITALVKAYQENEEFRNKVNEVFNDIKSIISDVMSIISDIISMAWGLIKGIWNNGLSQILAAVGSVLASMVSAFTTRLAKVTSVVRTAISLVKAIFSGDFKSAESIVNGILQNIVNAFNKKMETAKDKVNNAIQKIKSFFNFSWSLPKLKMPHISITGGFSLMPPKAPKFSVSWFSKGAIFKRPTVLGGMGIGDAHNGIGSNAEAILPINKLPQLLGLDKQNNSGNLNLNIENFNNNREQDIKELVEEIAFYLRRKNIAIGG